MKMNRLKYLILPLALALLAGCAATVAEPEPVSGAEAAEIAVVSSAETEPRALDLSSPDIPVEGVSYSGGVFTICEPGQYRVSGTLSGKLAVDADGEVELILAGAYITGPEGISILSSAAVTINAEAGTVNTLYDGIRQADDTATAALLSYAPLTIGGEGALSVYAGGNNGVQSKSVLYVTGGLLTVKAANNGLKADSGMYITGGTLDITAGGNGIRAEEGRIASGDVYISGGDIMIAASERGIKADGTAALKGGSISVASALDAVKGGAVSVSGGSLNANAAGDGVQADTLLSVSGGTLDITAGEDGLRGGSVTISGGSLTVASAGDGLQADTVVSVSSGTLSVTSGEDGLNADMVEIQGGSLTLDASFDGLQAITALNITGGTLDITTAGGGGGAVNKSGDGFGFPPMRSSQTTVELDYSAKGLKSDGDIYISDAVIDLSTADDAVHAGVMCVIDSGELTILATDDALHSDDVLEINGGTITVNDCFEGIEAFAIDVNGGDIVIRAVNDGINANGSEFGMFGWGRESQSTSDFTSVSGAETTYFRLNDGSIDLVVTGNTNNVGDGIDSNGYVYINGGVLTVSTFGNTQEGGIDTGRDGPIITGGMVMAGGASMMQESCASESTQCCAVITCDLQAAGTPVTIYDEDGNEIWSVTLANVFNCIVLSHPDLEPGHVYTVDYGGGTQTLDFSSSNILRVGSNSSGWGMMGGFGMPGGFR